MNEVEFKRMLGIHRLDHVDFFAQDTQELLRQYYPNLELDIKNNIQECMTVNGSRMLIRHDSNITIKWKRKTVKRTVTSVTNKILLEMMKELDPL